MMSMVRQILHVDMDAFFASVEQKDHPELLGKAVLVGGSAEQRGVVAACSYEARRFGVHSAMPMSQALRLCPEGIILPVRMSRYSEVSKQIQKIFYDYTPKVEPISINEAFLDVTGSIELLGQAPTIGKKSKKTLEIRPD
jgi:DNA polymerase-4